MGGGSTQPWREQWRRRASCGSGRRSLGGRIRSRNLLRRDRFWAYVRWQRDGQVHGSQWDGGNRQGLSGRRPGTRRKQRMETTRRWRRSRSWRVWTRSPKQPHRVGLRAVPGSRRPWDPESPVEWSGVERGEGLTYWAETLKSMTKVVTLNLLRDRV